MFKKVVQRFEVLKVLYMWNADLAEFQVEISCGAWGIGA